MLTLFVPILQPKMNHFSEIVQTIVQSGSSSHEKVKTLLYEGYQSDFFSFVIAVFPDMGAVFTEDHNEKLKGIQQRTTDYNTQAPSTFAS
ncbi:hypothetical protein [Thalassobacillus pellis]|uniref:hypothetical protein n=1 Tax=Thalassobacillus pellis TaxID=748008 RepID=UPI001960A063|nr:hypothetical protein [Thalassobacillus pellis]MBM7552099.1 hypothetical protein [Thalassobacillus pellis]